MKTLRDFDFYNKRVLVRVDFNVPLGDDNRVDEKEDWRLKASRPTIDYLLKQGAKIILLAHLGRPGGKVMENLRLNPIAKRLEELLSQAVIKLDDCFGQKVEKRLKDIQKGEIVLLENLRFHKGEETNDPDFSRKLAGLGEIYVNDAFGNIHRAHASIVGLPEYLPAAAGLLLEKEIEALSKILENPKCPLVVIIGGVKISTKIQMIEKFLAKADNLILGGALANTVIAAKGLAIGQSIIDKEMVEEVKKMELTDTKLHLPVDVIVSTNSNGQEPSRITGVANTREKEMILDIGPDTIKLFNGIIKPAKMIFWNGPMGFSEVKEFSHGTKAVAEAIVQSAAFSVAGGGETINCLAQFGLTDKINHISTGGGALLKFLAGEKLPGIEALG